MGYRFGFPVRYDGAVVDAMGQFPQVFTMASRAILSESHSDR